MECSRCGGEAVVKRDNAVYCGKCALARDWQEIIHVVQNERVSLTSKPPASAPGSKPDSGPPSGSASKEKPPLQMEDPAGDGGEATAQPEAPGPKADPFA